MSKELQAQYHYAVKQYRDGASIEDIEDTLHALAEAQEPNTKLFLQELLNHEYWLARKIAVTLLCFHYPDIAPEIIQQLETMLLNDPSDFVRLSLPLALEQFVTWPNTTFFSALQQDPDIQVRAAVLSAILKLHQVSRNDSYKIYDIVRKYDHLPTLQDLQQLLEEHQLPSDFLRNLD